jgi:hypothetical protein
MCHDGGSYIPECRRKTTKNPARMVVWSKGAQIFKKFGSHRKMLGARRVI